MRRAGGEIPPTLGLPEFISRNQPNKDSAKKDKARGAGLVCPFGPPVLSSQYIRSEIGGAARKRSTLSVESV